MPRGVPKKTQTDGKGISKMEAVRRALAELDQDAQPSDIQALVKSKFGIEMERTMISNYKTSLKSASKGAVIRKPGRRVKAVRIARSVWKTFELSKS
jgi:hypothetical protein